MTLMRPSCAHQDTLAAALERGVPSANVLPAGELIDAVDHPQRAWPPAQEPFDAFGATLLPIMGELGADPGQPHVSPVHNIIEG